MEYSATLYQKMNWATLVAGACLYKIFAIREGTDHVLTDMTSQNHQTNQAFEKFWDNDFEQRWWRFISAVYSVWSWRYIRCVVLHSWFSRNISQHYDFWKSFHFMISLHPFTQDGMKMIVKSFWMMRNSEYTDIWLLTLFCLVFCLFSIFVMLE